MTPRNTLALLIIAIALIGCQQESPRFEENIASVEALEAHTQEFEQQVIEVTEGVYVAIGYGLANSIMIEGEDGRIIVDVMESVQRAACRVCRHIA